MLDEEWEGEEEWESMEDRNLLVRWAPYPTSTRWSENTSMLDKACTCNSQLLQREQMYIHCTSFIIGT